MQDMKSKVLGIFWDEFVLSHVPPQEAHVGTLGGLGYEERLWSKRGIRKSHGWLVERDREKRRSLMPKGYRILNELRGLPEILAGIGEDRLRLDGFHFDLCGTFGDEAREDFAPILPLVLQSTGKCLAITVSDARRNLILEGWGDYFARGKKLFGRETSLIYEELLKEQKLIPINKESYFSPFDPEKGAKREFGLLVKLCELFSQIRASWQPIQMKRFAYVSTYSGSKYRMRTYFFRFYQVHAGRRAKAFAHRWVASPLYYGNNGEIQEVEFVRNSFIDTETQPKGIMPSAQTTKAAPEVSELSRLIALCGNPKIKAEYAALIKKGTDYDELIGTLEGIRKILPQVNGNSPETVVRSDPASRTSHSETRVRKKWEDLSPGDQFTWLMGVLEVRAQMTNRDEWKARWKEMLIEKFGHFNDPFSHRMSGILAHTSGGFRSKFEGRLLKDLGEETARPLIERLKRLPTKAPECTLK
jgi:hypothetical protein